MLCPGRALCSLLLVLFAYTSFARPPILVMERVAVLEGPSTDSMAQPTDVVVGPSGTTWVLDGANLRIAVFSAAGQFDGYFDLVERKKTATALSADTSTSPGKAARRGGARDLSPGTFGDRRPFAAKIFGPPPESTPTTAVQPSDRRTTPPEPLALPLQPVIEKPAVPADRLPVALGLDAAGRLLVGNRHTGKIEIREADGELVSTVVVPREPSERAADPTDVLVSKSGQSLLVVDNDNHCLKEVDLRGRLLRRIGKRGSGTGEMHYPATAALGAGDRLLVADVMNARVDVFGRDGSPLGIIGGRGVTAGRFYRPKGVAVDGFGRVHVTDSFMGVVQAFDPEGQLIGVWGDASGRPHRLRSPASVFVDGSGRIYVVEMLANRVSVWQERDRP